MRGKQGNEQYNEIFFLSFGPFHRPYFFLARGATVVEARRLLGASTTNSSREASGVEVWRRESSECFRLPPTVSMTPDFFDP